MPDMNPARDDNKASSVIRMKELVTSRDTIDGVVMDVRPLLQRMDLCTCAAAEQHTGVQCVTVSMGDVVFEYLPRLGDLLELTAWIVYTGTTSLDVLLRVTSQTSGASSSGSTTMVHITVCECTFTYVTTKGPNGEKRFCPPLVVVPLQNEKLEWEVKLAQHRRNLLQIQRQRQVETNQDRKCHEEEEEAFDLMSHEVVLPPHQNHMGHTFGGVVMAWMAKAALAVAAQQSQRAVSTLCIRAVLRVDFECGSSVSDHLVLHTRINAIFDQGRSAEVQVRVQKRSLTTGQATCMNTGYFYVSGSQVGTGTDIPFATTRPQSFSNPDTLTHVRRAAVWRRTLLLARRRLLGGVGNPVSWDPALQSEACLLTIKSVLRLAHHHESTVQWKSLPMSSHDCIQTVEWTPGENWGRKDTFVIRVKGTLRSATSLQKLLDVLRTKRPDWDDHCQEIEPIEEAKGANDSELLWDIVLHKAITPKAVTGNVQGSAAEIPAIIPYCLLRTWNVDEAAGSAIFASQSVQHGLAGNVAGAVRPSGWFLDKQQKDQPGIRLTYIAEQNLLPLRKICVGMPDERIVQVMTGLVIEWFQKLDSLDALV